MAPWSDWPHVRVATGVPGGRRVQYAALPYRVRRDGEVQIRLITSRETRRWVIPKGWPIKGLTPPKTAARECYEEAGLVGVVSREPLGAYTYEKRLGTRSVLCDVLVFPLKVKRLLQKWPERFQRYGFWFSVETAAAAVQEEDLSELILSFGAIMARRWAEKNAETAGAEEQPEAKEKPAKVKAAKAQDDRASGSKAKVAKGKDPATAQAEPEAPKVKALKEAKPAKADAKPSKAKPPKAKTPKAKAGKAKAAKDGETAAIKPESRYPGEAGDNETAPIAVAKTAKTAKKKVSKAPPAKAKTESVEPIPAEAVEKTKDAAKKAVAKPAKTATPAKAAAPAKMVTPAKVVRPKATKGNGTKAKVAVKAVPAKGAPAKSAAKAAITKKPAVKAKVLKTAQSPLASVAEAAGAIKKGRPRNAAAPKSTTKPAPKPKR